MLKNLVFSCFTLLCCAGAFAADSGFNPEDQQTYEQLKVQAEVSSIGVNQIHYRKSVGRLGCVKIATKNEQAVVGFFCDLENSPADSFVPDDRLIYKALNVQETEVSRGANSVHFEKTSGRLTCRKTATADGTTVGYLCSL